VFEVADHSVAKDAVHALLARDRREDLLEAHVNLVPAVDMTAELALVPLPMPGQTDGTVESKSPRDSHLGVREGSARKDVVKSWQASAANQVASKAPTDEDVMQDSCAQSERASERLADAALAGWGTERSVPQADPDATTSWTRSRRVLALAAVLTLSTAPLGKALRRRVEPDATQRPPKRRAWRWRFD
jgi:hypothetical protein